MGPLPEPPLPLVRPGPGDAPAPASPAGADAGVPRPRPPGRTGRLEEWRHDPRVSVAALLAVAIAAGFAWYRIGAAGAPAADGGPPAATASASTAPTRRARPASAAAEPGPDAPSGAAPGGEGELVAHVVGAVARPGVVHLRAGARVADALASAGGPVPGADPDRLNLAARVVDGQKIVVARAGDPPTADAAGGDGAGRPRAAGASGDGARLSLNDASQAQLEALPGIGPTLAEAILRERDRRGGFRSVDELRSVRGIGDRRFADLRELVTP